jgi:hypothetical protein
MFEQPVPIPANFSIGFAAAELASPDVLSVWPYGPVADRVDVFLTHRDELGPAAIEATSGGYRLYYVEADQPTLGRLGVLGSGISEN